MRAYLNEIDLGEGFKIPRFLDIKDRDDVLVIEVSQQLHLAQGSQAEHGVVERGDFLDRNLLARGFVQGRATRPLVCLVLLPIVAGTLPDDPICALSHHILYVILFRHIEGYLSGVSTPCWGS